MSTRVVLLLQVLALLLGLHTAIADIAVKQFNSIYLQFGSNLGQTLPGRLTALLQKVNVPVSIFNDRAAAKLDEASLVLSIGDAPLSLQFVSLDNVKSEGFKMLRVPFLSNSTLLAVNGLPISNGYNYALDPSKVHYGAAVGAYALLESLGFSFLHPLQPFYPTSLSIQKDFLLENPYWTHRTWHIHTQHPLEFTEVLNGYDIPFYKSSENGPLDCDADTYCETWENMYNSLGGLFEWLIANRQNRVEVLLLGNKKWDRYNDLTSGPLRQDRLKKVNALAHEFGLLIGADIPLANLQQHGWAMINVRDPFAKQKKDIDDRIDWAFALDYDFISTESGLSEFTKPTCDTMLQLFDAFTAKIQSWNREALTKVHCSTGQVCTDVDSAGNLKYPDPRTGEAINFNYLPTYAPKGLAVMPHTVQVYSFDDPSAGSYGNANFSYMSDYMTYEAGLGKRDVLYYGESAYWVNVDVDVPIFLPLSGQRRLYDLRRTARLEKQGNFKISGQMNFESGWEFGYYISNAITARSVWNPHMEVEGEWEAFSLMLRNILGIFGTHTDDVVKAIVAFCQSQATLMIEGKVGGQAPADLSKLSGHAYLSGTDSWVDLPRLLGISLTQPDKVHLTESSDPQWTQAIALLKEMDRVMTAHKAVFDKILETASADGSLTPLALQYLNEIVDCVSIIAYRARQNILLYTSQDPSTSSVKRDALLLESRSVIKSAEEAMARRVAAFRVPWERVSGWREGPTTYPYGYIWAARSLYYFWRDQGQAEARSVMAAKSPCYLNRQEPMELGFAKGKVFEEVLRLALEKRARDANSTTIAELIAPCLAPPLHEYKFPRDL